MKLSIIIVNYNVEHFLEHCLISVRKALRGIDAEIFVVDNNSVDGSINMLKSKFPEVKLIINKENVGFAKANNQAIRESCGEYILLLNPDTVVQEDTFIKCIDFMDTHLNAGGLGLKMIDGQGKILKESKRGFTTPWVCFCKIIGLASLFPHSKKFAGYYMGYLSYEENNEVDVLAGAYMFLRKKCLDRIGLLDETFFMYGEDIDLSYRIIKGGYKNYYLADTSIIHYKGESTKKGSANYVYTFYNAMDIFAKKHFSQSSSRVFSLIIKLAIWARASMSLMSRIMKKAFLPILDFLLVFLGFFLLERFWAVSYWHDINYYPLHYIVVAIPCYIVILLFAVYLFGGYGRFKPYKILYGVFSGMLILLVFYSLLPSNLRYSRAMVVMGSFLTAIILITQRYLLHFIKYHTWNISDKANNYAIVGDKEETQRVAKLLRRSEIKIEFIGFISTEDTEDKDYFIGDVKNLKEILRIYNISEVIFCSRSFAQNKIIETMGYVSDRNIRFGIAPEVGDFIIGSDNVSTPKDAYIMSVSSIVDEDNKRKKRFFDVCSSLLVLILTPIVIFLCKKHFRCVWSSLLVLFGCRTFVGYDVRDIKCDELPKIKRSILSVCENVSPQECSLQTVHRLNLMYANNWGVKRDVDILVKNFRNI